MNRTGSTSEARQVAKLRCLPPEVLDVAEAEVEALDRKKGRRGEPAVALAILLALRGRH